MDLKNVGLGGFAVKSALPADGNLRFAVEVDGFAVQGHLKNKGF